MASIELDENAGVKVIKKFYTDLSDMLAKEDTIVLDFSRVKRIDLSVAQVIIAANRVAKDKNTLIKLKGISEEVGRQLELTGLGSRQAGGAE